MYTTRIKAGDSVFIAGLRLRLKWSAGRPVLCIRQISDGAESEIQADREVVKNGARLRVTLEPDDKEERAHARLLIGAPRELKITKECAA